jgi:small subunit ribosomal protein S8e
MSQFGVQIHRKSARKSAGNGKLKLKNRDKKRYEMGGYFTATKFGSKNVSKKVRVHGGIRVHKLKSISFANLLTKDGYKKVKITRVVESKDNRNFSRLNIITKGTVIDTEAGQAVVVNRPGRDNVVNAKLKNL